MNKPKEIITARYISSSPDETESIGRELAMHLKAGDIVCLSGELGAGKTCFAKGIASAFGIDESGVHSPTFTLINEYEGEVSLYHFDFYRVNTLEEAFRLGIEEYFYSNGICLVEWPEKIAGIIPGHAVKVHFRNLEERKREITVTTV